MARYAKVIDIEAEGQMTDNLNSLYDSSLIIFNLIHIYLSSVYKREIIHIAASVQMCFV